MVQIYHPNKGNSMEQSKSQTSFIEKASAVIVDRRSIVFFIFIALCIFSAFSRNWVKVCDDITAYLPDTTETRTGLTIMEDNFTTFATAEIMVENVTLETAERLADEIEKINGVKSVDFDDTEAHFKSASALLNVTFDGTDNDEISIDGLEAVKSILSPYDLYIVTEIGNPLKAIVNSEMLIVDIVAVVIVVSVLLLTSRTYAEIIVLLMTFGAAAILNMGTNFMMGEISFVTDSIAIVLQLALAIDYAIIMLHHFQEERERYDARDAAVAALSEALVEISASSLTTIAGLAAICLMQFKLGPDMGIVLIKAIALSMCSVFFLMPGLLVVFSDWIDKTPHSNFVPRIDFLGKFDYATRFVMPVIFVAFLVAGFIFSQRTEYAYSEDDLVIFRQNEAQHAEEKIADIFGDSTQLAVIVPSGDYDREKRMIFEMESLPQTEYVLGLANVEAMDGYCIADSLTPRQFSEISELDYEVCEALYLAYSVYNDDYARAITGIDTYTVPLIDMLDYLIEKEKDVSITLDADTKALLEDLEEQINDAKLQLNNNGWTRIVVETDLPVEGNASFRYLDVLHGITARYYDTSYIIGDITSSYDLQTSFENDNLLISILTIAFVIIVLIFSFKSVGLPVLLIAIIQGSIWINFSLPYLRGEKVFFLAYLIISSIQMGANIDYAIVISSRYLQLKNQMSLKEAMIETLNFAFPTIITSGTMLASAGFIIAFLSSEPTIATIGKYLGQGTLISIFLVMCVLPQILLLGDIIIRKTQFTVKNPIQMQNRTGTMKINGHVRGNINGFVDGDFKGTLSGDLNAVVTFGRLEVEESPREGETDE